MKSFKTIHKWRHYFCFLFTLAPCPLSLPQSNYLGQCLLFVPYARIQEVSGLTSIIGFLMTLRLAPTI